MRAIPLSFKEATAYVEKNHRHHAGVPRDKFRIGVEDDDGRLCGVIQVGNPVSRMLMDGYTLEVTRCCTDGTKNACSFLYSRAARIAKEMGYRKIITYILEEEDGASLRASGWKVDATHCGGGTWNSPSRPRELIPAQMSLFPQKEKYPIGRKTRYCKELS